MTKTTSKRRTTKYSKEEELDILNDINNSMKKNVPVKFKIIPKFKNKKQKELYDIILNNRITIIKGSAGTGKTFVSLMASLECLKNKQDFNIDKVIITKPLVEASNNMGHLPGTLADKISPYMHSFRSNFKKIIGEEQTNFLLNNDIIKEVPLNFIRGNTIGDSDVEGNNTGHFAILDEAQNATIKDVKLFISRLGEGSKMVIMGDDDQTDLKLNKGEKSGLEDAYDRFQNIKGVGFFEFDEDDIVRDPFLSEIMKRYKVK
jgi:phosphate starvation-inducible PhoH-like protein